MRIAFVYDLIYPYSKGGVERRVFEVARRLVRRGHHVTVYGTKMWDGPSTKSVQGVVLRGIDAHASITTRSGRRSIWHGAVFALRCARLIGHHEYDIVDVQSMAPLTCLAVLSVCRARNVASVVTWHEVWSDYWRDYLGLLGRIGMWTERMVGSLAASHLAVSKHTAARLALIGLHDVDIVPNGVEPTVFVPRLDTDAREGITYVGRFAPHKNLDLLIQAVRDLSARGLKPRVTLVGEGPLWDEVVRAAADLENVVVTRLNEESDVADLLASSRVFVLTSSREGFGLAALEALSCGVPVVTIDSPQNAAADLVRDGQNGLKCPGEARGVARALELILSDDDLHRRLARGAVESAKDYDWDSSIMASERAYQELLTRRAPRHDELPTRKGSA